MIIYYTAIFDDYDKIIDPLFAKEWLEKKNLKLICFTDNAQMQSPYFEVRHINRKFKDATLENRFYKLNPHRLLQENYDISIYVDGNVIVKERDLFRFINNLTSNNDADIFVAKHPFRNCLYEEAKMCIERQKDDEKIINRQIIGYKKSNYPKNNGLSENRVLIVKNTLDANNFFDYWWQEVFWGSKRDQLSFKYTSWMLPNVKIKYLNWENELINFSEKINHSKHKHTKRELILLKNARSLYKKVLGTIS